VGRKRPNAWGIYDCHGNISEWCLDGFEAYPGNPREHPDFCRKVKLKVLRGGLYFAAPSAERASYPPNWADDWTGFRVVMECQPREIVF
jgi:formylglycine-generating enzyme required for sulfatase activity